MACTLLTSYIAVVSAALIQQSWLGRSQNKCSLDAERRAKPESSLGSRVDVSHIISQDETFQADVNSKNNNIVDNLALHASSTLKCSMQIITII